MLLKSLIAAAFLAKYLLPMHINAQKSQIGNFKEFDAIIEDPQNVKNDISTFAASFLAGSFVPTLSPRISRADCRR